MKSTLLEDLLQRGLLKDCTDVEALDELLASGRKIAVYCGFDPTAESLHAGSLMALVALRRFQQHGHTVVPVLGTATGLVGDPSGRTEARPVMTSETLDRNVAGIARSIRLVLSGENIEIRSNADWMRGIKFLDFIRDIGSKVSIKRMLALDSVRARLDDPDGTMSFMEFTYSLLQGYDFLHLTEEFPVLVQLGGSDQWGNIVMGIELIRREVPTGVQAFGLTTPLLTNARGEKMGKSVGGAVWLNPDMLSHIDFFQFWRNIDDAKAVELLKQMTDVPLDEIAQWRELTGEAINPAKERLAYEVTALVRGQEAADAALQAVHAVFSGGIGDGLPTVAVTDWGMTHLPALILSLGLVGSAGEAKRLIQGGGVRINDVKIDRLELTEADFVDGRAKITVGRKRHGVLIRVPNEEGKNGKTG